MYCIAVVRVWCRARLSLVLYCVDVLIVSECRARSSRSALCARECSASARAASLATRRVSLRTGSVPVGNAGGRRCCSVFFWADSGPTDSTWGSGSPHSGSSSRWAASGSGPSWTSCSSQPGTSRPPTARSTSDSFLFLGCEWGFSFIDMEGFSPVKDRRRVPGPTRNLVSSKMND